MKITSISIAIVLLLSAIAVFYFGYTIPGLPFQQNTQIQSLKAGEFNESDFLTYENADLNLTVKYPIGYFATQDFQDNQTIAAFSAVEGKGNGIAIVLSKMSDRLSESQFYSNQDLTGVLLNPRQVYNASFNANGVSVLYRKDVSDSPFFDNESVYSIQSLHRCKDYDLVLTASYSQDFTTEEPAINYIIKSVKC